MKNLRTRSWLAGAVVLAGLSIFGLTGCGSSPTGPLPPTASSPSGVGPSSAGNPVVVVQNGALIRLTADGQNPVAITRGSQDSSPAFSPDCRHLVFSRVSQDGSGTADIYRVEFDGTDLLNLTPGFAFEAVDPSYSYDGSRITFSAQVSPSSYDIYVMNADGSDIKVVTSGSQADRHPEFSPDGSNLVFERDNHIARVDLATRKVTLLTTGPDVDTRPTYCPPGDVVLFTRNGDLYTITNGQTIAQFTNTPTDEEFESSHSTSHDQVYALAAPIQGRGELQRSAVPTGDLYVMNLQGANRQRLTTGLGASGLAIAPSATASPTASPSPASTKDTFTLQIENLSSYPASEVFINITGKNEALTAWYYLGSPTSSSLTEYDDQPGQLLNKNADGSFVGNAKYFFKLSDMQAVGNSTTLYTMEVPRANLYSGRIYLSFGQTLPGVGITAPGYAFNTTNGAPSGAGVPITSAVNGTGTSDANGTVITGLSVNANSQIFAGEPVSGGGLPPGAVVSSVTNSSQITLSAPATASSNVSLTFTPPPFNQLSLQGPSFTGSPDWKIPFEFMELSATRDLTIADPYYTLFVNTSVVDFFSVGLGMRVDFTSGSNQTVGFVDGARQTLLSDFNALNTTQAAFQGYVLTNGTITYGSNQATTSILRVLAPQDIIQLQPGGPMSTYLDAAITQGWNTYTNTVLNITDTLTGHNPYGFTYAGNLITGGILGMTCTNATGSNLTQQQADGLGEVYKLPKPTTFIVFKCDDTAPPPNSYSNSGTQAHKRLSSLLLSALNRGVFDNYQSWANDNAGNTTFYKRSDGLYNVYAELLHKYALNAKVYAFGYDDIYGQDPTIAGPIGLTQNGQVPPGNPIGKVTVKIPAFSKF